MKVIYFTDATFDEAIQKEYSLAVVTFYADWCGPCRDFSPNVSQLARDLSDIAVVGKINIDQYPALAKRLAINGVPTTVVINSGKPIDRITGNVNYEYLKPAILRALGKSVPANSEEPAESKKSPVSRLLETISNGLKALFSRTSKNK